MYAKRTYSRKFLAISPGGGDERHHKGILKPPQPDYKQTHEIQLIPSGVGRVGSFRSQRED